MTPDQREDLLASLRVGVPIDKAARAVRATVAAVRAFADRDDAFADALERAECEGTLLRREAEQRDEANRAAWVKAQRAGTDRETREAAERALEPKRGKRAKEPVDDSNRWDVARREAAEIAPGVLGLLLWMDHRLAELKFHSMSPWWTWTARNFYGGGKRWLLCRVGRGGGKSTTLTRVAACEGIFGARVIPPGQRWVWPFISVGTADARRRIDEIKAILAALGVMVEPKYPQGLPTIEVDDAGGNAIAFVALASNIAGVSGPSTIGATIDEEAKLRDKATNANPSTEILASLIQTFRARNDIHAIRCSSAWTTEGSHAQSIADGDTMAVHVARVGERFLPVVLDGLHEVAAWEDAMGNAAGGARIRAYAATVTAESPNIPTWLANPSITAVRLREEVEAIPSVALDGLTREQYFLRENASLPLAPGVVGVPEEARPRMTVEEIRALGEWNRRLNAPPERDQRGGAYPIRGGYGSGGVL